MTTDNKPDAPGEMERLQAAGGLVIKIEVNGEPKGESQVYIPKTKNSFGLSMSRCLGNTDFKTCGVTAVPIQSQIEVKNEAIDYIVLASKGMWDVMSNEDVAVFVQENMISCRSTVPTLQPDIITPSSSTIS
jgi:serine/threonine protein phosphatase PrpC